MLKIGLMLDKGAHAPEKGHKDDAAYDLKTPKSFRIGIGESMTIDTGVHMVIPQGYCGVIESKSGLNVKADIITTGLVDAGYTGSIVVKLYRQNMYDAETWSPRTKYIEFEAGDKIAQIRIVTVPETELEFIKELPETERGDGGFGSTGR